MAFGDIIQRAEGQSASAASLNVSFSGTPVSGNLLIAIVMTGAADLTSVVSGGNGWTLAQKWQNATESDSCGIYYRIAGASEATQVTFTPSATDEVAMCLIEVEGPWESSPVDQTTNPGRDATGTSYDCGTTGTLSQADEFAVAAVYTRDSGNSDPSATSWSNSFVEHASSSIATSNKTISAATLLVAATTAITTTFTFVNSTVSQGGIVTFKKQAAGGGGTTHTETLEDTLALTDEDVFREYLLESSDTTDLVDESSDFQVRGRVAADTLTLVDGFVSWRRLVRQLDESLVLFDELSKTVIGAGQIITRTLSEAIEFSDGFVSWVRYRRVSDDTLDLVDAFSKLTAGAGITYSRILSDALVMIDDTGQRWTFRRSELTDTLQLPDELVRGTTRGRVSTDTVAALDSLTKWYHLLRELGEDVEIAEGAVKVRQSVRTLTDEMDLTDQMLHTLFLDQLSPTEFRLSVAEEPFQFGVGIGLFA